MITVQATAPGAVFPAHAGMNRRHQLELDLPRFGGHFSVHRRRVKSSSAARGEMATRGLYSFKHDSELGNAHAHALFDRVKVCKKGDVEVARSFSDYAVTIDDTNLPPGVQLIKRVA